MFHILGVQYSTNVWVFCGTFALKHSLVSHCESYTHVNLFCLEEWELMQTPELHLDSEVNIKQSPFLFIYIIILQFLLFFSKILEV